MSDPNSSNELLEIGTVIEGRYEVVSLLGEGGFGVVYKARQISTGQFVAIKLLHPHKLIGASNADDEIERFRREMGMIAQLKHPNLVRLIDSGRLENGQLFTVLEFVEGEELAELIVREQRLNLKATHRLMVQVLEALAVAHSKGVVHRDLKPHNIMITRTARRQNAMVLDFGIATLVEDARDRDFVSVTKTGQIHGTPAYMAPEQLEGQITPQSDVYAWGLVYIECITGKPVVDADSVASAIFKQLSPEPVPIPEHIEHDGLRNILEKATQKDPDKRYLSADEVLLDIESVATASTSMPLAQITPSSDTVSRERDTIQETLALEDTVDDGEAGRLATRVLEEAGKNRDTGSSEDEPIADPESRSGHPSSSSRWIFAALALLLLGGVGGGAWWFMNRPAEPNTPPEQADNCPTGQTVTEDTQGQCCYPGQAWNGERCVGKPETCPPGYLVNGAEQTCSLPPCSDGMSRVDAVNCCWPEQAWSESQNRCIGVPSCPEQFIPHQEQCLAASEDAYLLFTSCEAGNMEPCVKLALHLQDGSGGVQRSATKAVELLSQACEQDNPFGCYHLGIANRVGLGLDKNTADASELFQTACDQGQREACFDLATLVEQQSEHSQDRARAVALLKKACEQGHVMGCDVLASRYRYGIGVARDLPQAAQLYQKACKGGYYYACTHLAWMLRDGAGIPQNDEKAAELLATSCENGETLACNNLADLVQAERATQNFENGVLGLRHAACTDAWYDACQGDGADTTAQ